VCFPPRNKGLLSFLELCFSTFHEGEKSFVFPVKTQAKVFQGCNIGFELSFGLGAGGIDLGPVSGQDQFLIGQLDFLFPQPLFLEGKEPFAGAIEIFFVPAGT
jgi:hypothetical protein